MNLCLSEINSIDEKIIFNEMIIRLLNILTNLQNNRSRYEEDNADNVDSLIYEWARREAAKWGTPKAVALWDTGLYFDIPGSHNALFYTDNAEYALLRMEYLNHKERKIAWLEVYNIQHMLAESPELMKLWLRNGEYIYIRETNGKGMKVVNYDYIRYLKPFWL